MQKFEITDKEQHQRFDKYLKRHLPLAPSSFIYKMLRKKNFTLNGHRADGSEQLKTGDIVTLFLSDETFAKFSGRAFVSAGQMESSERRISEGTDDRVASWLEAYHHIEKSSKGPGIILEDEDYLFADKPAGLLSQKAAPRDESLNEWFLGYLLEKGSLGADSLAEYTPSVCNRLDRNTSGIVICAKTLAGSQLMASMLRERTIHKFYHLIAISRTKQEGVIENRLVRNWRTNSVSVLCSGSDNRMTGTGMPDRGRSERQTPEGEKSGQDRSGREMAAKTSYRLLRYHAGQDLSYVEAELITGKTHQLRAHFAAIGHPILGDAKYGDEKANSRFRGMGVRCQLLHCSRVEFPDDPKIIPDAFGRYRGRVIQCPDPTIFSKLLQ